ncbi:MAG: acyl-CoA thioesterase [Candidatus Eisenbacteria bacterium]|uniref:Acyl-CoA thioesterase n=1 Tax=Eiseniibacteriota bacterium TaxID=2212470 RepID=A0A7Y2E943_UNCEI|nr:acyl-CoA thioesterase [Candidatus Eisenbacteria bacterium]
MTLAPRPAKDSQVEMLELMFPNDANPLGSVMGGRVMHFIDVAAAIAAARHCHRPCVTASVDHIDFRAPVKVGDLLVLKSTVNFTGRTSLEVGVRVEVEDRTTGKRLHTSSAYLTFVCLDGRGTPTEVPKVIPETADEKRRFEEAANRRAARLSKLGKG